MGIDISSKNSRTRNKNLIKIMNTHREISSLSCNTSQVWKIDIRQKMCIKHICDFWSHDSIPLSELYHKCHIPIEYRSIHNFLIFAKLPQNVLEVKNLVQYEPELRFVSFIYSTSDHVVSVAQIICTCSKNICFLICRTSPKNLHPTQLLVSS